MTRPDSPKLEAFKVSIDFDARVESPTLTEGVCATWPSPFTGVELLGPDWALASERTVRFYPCASRGWVVTRGEERVLVSVTVSSAGPGAVQGHFLSAAEATMLPVIGYQPACGDLGTLCVVRSRADDETLMWLYRNVLFEVTSFSSTVDIEPLSRWLQARAEGHLVDPLARSLPHVGRLELGARQIRVGQRLQAWTAEEAPHDTSAGTICCEVDGPALVVLEGWTLEARRPGPGLVRAVRFDASTLLQGAGTVHVNVAP